MHRSSISPLVPHPAHRVRRILLWVAIVLLALLAVLYLAVGFIAADKLTQPERSFSPEVTPANFGLAYEEVRFQARGGDCELAGWFIPSANNDRVVVLVHGRNASRTAAMLGKLPDLAAALQRAGLAVFMFDLRGHGQSCPGRFSFGLKERRDALGAVDWLLARGFEPGKIGMLGISLGAAASIAATAEEPAIGALATDSAFAELRPLVQARWVEESGLPQFFLNSALLMVRLRYGYDIMTSRPVQDIARVAPRPLLLMHSQIDQVIPVAHLEQLHAAAPWAEVWVRALSKSLKSR
jgi:dipeptidyl aminopeptidase/acylaminoacyl peptidase